MSTYRITSTATGAVLGLFEAHTPQGALDALYRAGHPSLEDYRSRIGDDPNDLVVSQVVTREQFADAAARMDPELREQVRAELGPAEPPAFLARYCELHRTKHGRDFSWEREGD